MNTVRAEAGAPARTKTSFWIWAGVAALLVLSVYTGWQAERLRRELAQLQGRSATVAQERTKLAKELADAERIAAILSDPASVQVSMPQLQKGAPAMRAYWHARLGIVVAGVRIPAPAGDRTLELWLLSKEPGRKPIPAGVLRPQADGKFVLLVSEPPAPMQDAKALAITEEPAGGSEQPTSAPRWVGAIG
jgi:hypothetical protein